MSRRRKQLHRKPSNRIRRARARSPWFDGIARRETADVAAQYACTTDGSATDLDDAKRASHDRLIDRLGDRRRGGVAWYVVDPERRESFMAEAEQLDDDGTERTVSYDDLRGWFADHPDGWLVVATCRAVRP